MENENFQIIEENQTSKWKIYQINLSEKNKEFINDQMGEFQFTLSVNNFLNNNNLINNSINSSENYSLFDVDFYLFFSDRLVKFPFYPTNNMISSSLLPLSTPKTFVCFYLFYF